MASSSLPERRNTLKPLLISFQNSRRTAGIAGQVRLWAHILNASGSNGSTLTLHLKKKSVIMHALKKLFFSRGHIIYVGDDARVRDHYPSF